MRRARWRLRQRMASLVLSAFGAFAGHVVLGLGVVARAARESAPGRCLATQRHRRPQGRRRPVRHRALSAPPLLLVRRCLELGSSRRAVPLGRALFLDDWAINGLGLRCFWARVGGLNSARPTSPAASAVVTISAHAPRAANA